MNCRNTSDSMYCLLRISTYRFSTVALCLTVLCALTVAPCRHLFGKEHRGKQRLEVKSKPAGAKIFIDGSFYGYTNKVCRVRGNERRITIQKLGYRETTVYLRPGQRRVDVRLSRKPKMLRGQLGGKLWYAWWVPTAARKRKVSKGDSELDIERGEASGPFALFSMTAEIGLRGKDDQTFGVILGYLVDTLKRKVTKEASNSSAYWKLGQVLGAGIFLNRKGLTYRAEILTGQIQGELASKGAWETRYLQSSVGLETEHAMGSGTYVRFLLPVEWMQYTVPLLSVSHNDPALYDVDMLTLIPQVTTRQIFLPVRPVGIGLDFIAGMMFGAIWYSEAGAEGNRIVTDNLRIVLGAAACITWDSESAEGEIQIGYLAQINAVGELAAGSDEDAVIPGDEMYGPFIQGRIRF